jgi:hypothetical protein
LNIPTQAKARLEWATAHTTNTALYEHPPDRRPATSVITSTFLFHDVILKNAQKEWDMKYTCAIMLLGTILFSPKSFGQTQVPNEQFPVDNIRLVPASDPSVAPILEMFKQPTSAWVVVNDVRIKTSESIVCRSSSQSIGVIDSTTTVCDPRGNFLEEHQLILSLNFHGHPVEVIGGCSSGDDRRCTTFQWLGDIRSLKYHQNSAAQISTSAGAGDFVIERRKGRMHMYYIYPVEGRKPNHRYYIPLATVNGVGILGD